MSDDETWWDRFLDKHRRIDRVDTWVWRHRPTVLYRRWKNRRYVATFQAGTTFLEHGETPAVIYYLDEYDGYNAVSLVDGRFLVGSLLACGPEPIDWRDAERLALEMREEESPSS